MAAMELVHYESHLDITDKCTVVATEIHPYYEKVVPKGVKETIALNPDLSVCSDLTLHHLPFKIHRYE